MLDCRCLESTEQLTTASLKSKRGMVHLANLNYALESCASGASSSLADRRPAPVPLATATDGGQERK